LIYNYAERKIEDVSAFEFSENQSDIDNLRNSVVRVMNESKAGKQTSANILKDILPSFLDSFIKEKKKKDGKEG